MDVFPGNRSLFFQDPQADFDYPQPPQDPQANFNDDIQPSAAILDPQADPNYIQAQATQQEPQVNFNYVQAQLREIQRMEDQTTLLLRRLNTAPVTLPAQPLKEPLPPVRERNWRRMSATEMRQQIPFSTQSKEARRDSPHVIDPLVGGKGDGAGQPSQPPTAALSDRDSEATAEEDNWAEMKPDDLRRMARRRRRRQRHTYEASRLAFSQRQQ